MATKTVWRVYVNYGEGYGWVPVSWAGTFETKAEADDWINGDHGWEAMVEAQEDEVEVDDEPVEDVVEQSHPTLSLSVTQAEHLMGTLAEILAHKLDDTLEDIYDQLVLLLVEETNNKEGNNA
jgi:hypothetical protein